MTPETSAETPRRGRPPKTAMHRVADAAETILDVIANADVAERWQIVKALIKVMDIPEQDIKLKLQELVSECRK